MKKCQSFHPFKDLLRNLCILCIWSSWKIHLLKPIIAEISRLIFSTLQQTKQPTPWKINGWNLQITHEKKGTWSEPNLHEDMFHVDLQVCKYPNHCLDFSVPGPLPPVAGSEKPTYSADILHQLWELSTHHFGKVIAVTMHNFCIISSIVQFEKKCGIYVYIYIYVVFKEHNKIWYYENIHKTYSYITHKNSTVCHNLPSILSTPFDLHRLKVLIFAERSKLKI